jgi:hypothetical protein
MTKPAETASSGPMPDSFVIDPVPSGKIIKDLTRVPRELRRNVSRFADSRWDLSPLVEKKTVAYQQLTVNFETFPLVYRETAKRLVWAHINVATPTWELERATTTRTLLAPTSVADGARLLRQWMTWLVDRNIRQFSDVTDTEFDAYADKLNSSGVDRLTVSYKLWVVTRAWLYADFLPPADRLPRPPWEKGSTPQRTELLGPANRSSENKTPPLDPQTMSALLIWALRFVEDFSADIIAAQNMKATPPQVDPHIAALPRQTRVRYYLDQRREGSGTAPGMVPLRNRSKRWFAKSFIVWELGLSQDDAEMISLHPKWVRGLKPTEEANLPLVVRGRIDGTTQWVEAINFYEVETLCRHLATAGFIVLAYLTGMRGEECRALQRGCCRASTNKATGQKHFEIRGKTYKGALNKEGNADPSGADREYPWLAIAPVARAIAVIEALHPESTLLFPVEAFTALPTRSRTAVSVPTHMVATRIGEFITWCNNNAVRLGRNADIIPPDPEGGVAVKRFRRTFAWFIYRKPGGRIALGVQYGHLRGHTTDGYGSRVANGLRDVFPMEEALARSEYLEEAHSRLEDGEEVSGPAAQRYTEAMRLYGQEFRGRYMSGKQAAALKANPRLRIYDNAARFVTCCYDQSKAQCHPARLEQLGTGETPDINHCQPTCGNIARTDRNIEQARAAIIRHEEEIASFLTPEPIRARLAQRVEALKAIVQNHNERTT